MCSAFDREVFPGVVTQHISRLRTWVQCLMARLLDGRKVGLFRLEKGRLRGDLAVLSADLKDGCNKEVSVSFSRLTRVRM